MKITIDTNAKTIKVEETVNFCELNKELKSMLGDSLKDYSVLPIETPPLKWVNPQDVWWQAPITYGASVINAGGQVVTYPYVQT